MSTVRILRLLALLTISFFATVENATVATAQLVGEKRSLITNAFKPTWFADLRAGLPAGSTFTRASGRTCFDATGLMVTLGNNVPCFYVDPATGTPWGYLAEMQSTNAVTWSNAIAAHWVAGAKATVTDNAVVGPAGTSNLSSIIEDNTTGAHGDWEIDFSTTSGSVYGTSAVVKNISGSRWFQMNIGGGDYANFRPSDGAIGSHSTNFSSLAVRSLGGGLYRVSALFTAPLTVSTQIRIYIVSASDSNGASSYAGDGTSGFAVGYYQAETAGVGVTSIIPTAGSTATRSQDLLSLPLTSLPGWNANKGGVLVAAYRNHTVVTGPATQGVVGLTNGGSTNAVFLNANYIGAGTRRSFNTSAGVDQITSVGGGIAASLPFVRTKTAFGWGTNRGFFAYDGLAANGQSGTYALPVGLTTVNLGMTTSGNNLNGTLESIAYYAGARSDAFVQQVSRPRRRRSSRDRIRSRGVRRAIVLRRAA